MKYVAKVTGWARVAISQTFTVEADSLDEAHQALLEEAQGHVCGWDVADFETDEETMNVVDLEPLDEDDPRDDHDDEPADDEPGHDEPAGTDSGQDLILQITKYL